MYGVTRRKSVIDPLNDEVKARIVGRDRVDPVKYYVSSGSEHSAHSYDDVTASLTFSELIFGGEVCEAEKHDSDDSDGNSSSHEAIKKPIRLDYTDKFQNLLRAHVLHALQLQMLCYASIAISIAPWRSKDGASVNTPTAHLFPLYTKWESSGGNYEFIEVLSAETRYFVDLRTRATTSYERLLQYLPVIFVGKIEEMKLILKAMSDGG